MSREVKISLKVVILILFSIMLYNCFDSKCNNTKEEIGIDIGDWVATKKSNNPFVDSSIDLVFLITDIKEGGDGRLYYKFEKYSLKDKIYFGDGSDNEIWFRDGFYREIIINNEMEVRSWKDKQ